MPTHLLEVSISKRPTNSLLWKSIIKTWNFYFDSERSIGCYMLWFFFSPFNNFFTRNLAPIFMCRIFTEDILDLVGALRSSYHNNWEIPAKNRRNTFFIFDFVIIQLKIIKNILTISDLFIFDAYNIFEFLFGYNCFGWTEIFENFTRCSP